jgi:hypothetical protein
MFNYKSDCKQLHYNLIITLKVLPQAAPQSHQPEVYTLHLTKENTPKMMNTSTTSQAQRAVAMKAKQASSKPI